MRTARSGDGMARECHLPNSSLPLLSYLSSTWGRADQHTSQDSIESGAFCFAANNPHSRRRALYSSFLIPHSSFLIPHSSFLIPFVNSSRNKFSVISVS